MSELDFYIKKLQDLEYRGEWKDIYFHSYEKVHFIIYNSHYLRRNFYLGELEKFHEVLIDLPFSPDDEEKLIFRKTQKHIIDLLFKVREENKKIFLAHGEQDQVLPAGGTQNLMKLSIEGSDAQVVLSSNVKEEAM